MKLHDVLNIGACASLVAALLMTGCPGPIGPVCGDGTCDVGEDMTTCPDDCTIGILCGNGTIDPGEQCDPPDGTTCDANCMSIGAVCGNGVMEVGEMCDPPGTLCGNGTMCDASCQCGMVGMQCDSINSLIMQIGCPGENCTLIDAAGNFGCQPAGTGADYASCDMTTPPCMAGSICAGVDPVFNCMPFCAAGGGGVCPGGGLCLFTIATVAGDVGLCTIPTQCNLLNQDCAGAGEGCYIVGTAGDTTCIGAGMLTEGDACMFINDCAAGLACAGMPGVCAPYCDLTAMPDPCTTGACGDFGGALPAPNENAGFCS